MGRPQMIHRGVLLVLASYAVYAWADALIKVLGRTQGIYEIGAVFTTVSLLMMLFTKPKGERLRDSFRFHHRWGIAAISVLRVTSSVTITYAFTAIPLADAYCIIFLIPVVLTILSVVVLKEDVRIERWLLVLISFVGVLLVVRPGFRDLQLGHVAAFIGACADAGGTTLTRIVSRKERRISLFIVPTLCSFSFYFVMLLATGFRVPDPLELGLMLLCGLCCGAAYMLYVTAVSTTPTSRIAPMLYSQMVWALVLGAAFFNEFPDSLALFGIVVIVVAGVLSVVADGARTRLLGHFGKKLVVPPDGPIAPPVK